MRLPVRARVTLTTTALRNAQALTLALFVVITLGDVAAWEVAKLCLYRRWR